MGREKSKTVDICYYTDKLLSSKLLVVMQSRHFLYHHVKNVLIFQPWKPLEKEGVAN